MIAPIGYFAAVAGAVVLIGLISLLWSRRPRPKPGSADLVAQRAVFGDTTGRVSQWRGVQMVEPAKPDRGQPVGNREQGGTNPGT